MCVCVCMQSGIDNPALGCGSLLETESTMRMRRTGYSCRMAAHLLRRWSLRTAQRTDLIGKVRLNGALL